jgi:HAE1 family hydrophobic/amphiphilic exporter-1
MALSSAPIHSRGGARGSRGRSGPHGAGVGPSSIDREQRVRQAKIGVDLQGRALGDVTADIQKVLDASAIPATFQVGFAGDVELMQESAQGSPSLLLAVTFIYIVLASQFESFTEPLIIMLALPLALVGALLMLWSPAITWACPR